MILNTYKKIVTNNHRFSVENLEYRKVYLLNIVLLALIVVCFYFTITNIFITGQTNIAIINLTAAVLSLFTIVYFHGTDNLKISIYLAVFIHFITLTVYLIATEGKNCSFSWICSFPPVIYFLLGIKKGNIFAVFFSIFMTAMILFHYKYWNDSHFTNESFYNIIISTLILIFLVNFYELSRKETAKFLENKNDELKSTNDALENSKNRLRLILDSAAEGICGIDLNGNCTFCNASCIKLLGYKIKGEILGKNIHEFVHNSTTNNTARNEAVIVKSDGTYFDAEFKTSPQYKEGIIIGTVITFMDITEQKKYLEEIKYLSCYDSLTGLLNRGCFQNTIKELDTEKNLPIAIIFADINGLKFTNDIFGHSAGDELIKKSAQILRSTCREKDIVARVGGDEFIIFLPNTEANDAKKIINSIRKALSLVIIEAFHCSMAFGCDIKSTASENLDRVMENAESKMYKEKTMKRRDLNEDILRTIITSLHNNLPFEKRHSENVSYLCHKIGEALNFSENNIKILKDAGFYHDIGKITVDFDILKKNTEFDATEKEEIRQHPAVGYRILSLFDDTLDLSESVYCHHERWDGKGYPKGIRNDEIPLMARIIAVAEAYDYYTSERSNPILTKEEALHEITSLSGTKYDPEIVNVFLKIMTEDVHTS